MKYPIETTTTAKLRQILGTKSNAITSLKNKVYAELLRRRRRQR